MEVWWGVGWEKRGVCWTEQGEWTAPDAVLRRLTGNDVDRCVWLNGEWEVLRGSWQRGGRRLGWLTG